MRRRMLGKPGLTVSGLGLGCKCLTPMAFMMTAGERFPDELLKLVDK